MRLQSASDSRQFSSFGIQVKNKQIHKNNNHSNNPKKGERKYQITEKNNFPL